MKSVQQNIAELKYNNPYEHKLIFETDGNFKCSCGEWGSLLIGPIKDNKYGITKDIVLRNHASHANAIVVQL